MAASNFGVDDAGAPSHHVRGETIANDGGTGKPIVMQVVLAGSHVRVYDGVESVVCTDTATHDLVVPANATHADIYFEGADVNGEVRYWHGATNPTSAVGIKLKDHELIVSANPNTFTAIKGGATNGGTLRVEYYHYA